MQAFRNLKSQHLGSLFSDEQALYHNFINYKRNDCFICWVRKCGGGLVTNFFLKTCYVTHLSVPQNNDYADCMIHALQGTNVAN